jgi:hypothetical protein
MTDDPRRAGSVVVSFWGDGLKGTLLVGDEAWGAVEWSEKRAVWCIEDAEGKCLRHTSSIRGQAASKEEAVARAEQMVRDGTMPAPEEARRLHREHLKREREKRAKQPAQVRRAQALEEEDRLYEAHSRAERGQRIATPYYELFDEAFDLADPDLWKSNSFAMLRPRLLTEVRAAVASLEHSIAHSRNRHGTARWGQRRPRKSELKPWQPNPEDERKLARARRILALLDDEPRENGRGDRSPLV